MLFVDTGLPCEGSHRAGGNCLELQERGERERERGGGYILVGLAVTVLVLAMSNFCYYFHY